MQQKSYQIRFLNKDLKSNFQNCTTEIINGNNKGENKGKQKRQSKSNNENQKRKNKKM